MDNAFFNGVGLEAKGLRYVMYKMDFYLQDDPREKPLRDALYRAIARLTDRPDGGHDFAALRQGPALPSAAYVTR